MMRLAKTRHPARGTPDTVKRAGWHDYVFVEGVEVLQLQTIFFNPSFPPTSPVNVTCWLKGMGLCT